MSEDAVQKPRRGFKKRYVALIVLPIILIAMLHLDYLVDTKVTYKVTVVAETRDGLKQSSAVNRLINRPRFVRDYNSGNPASNQGEALAIEVDKNTYVYAFWGTSLLYKGFPGSYAPTSRKGIQFLKSLKVGSTSEAKTFPVGFAYFQDPVDARSIKVIQPSYKKSVPDLRSLGPDIELKNIKVEIVKEPITIGVIDSFLPKNFDSEEFWKWLSDLKYGDPRRVSLSTFK